MTLRRQTNNRPFVGKVESPKTKSSTKRVVDIILSDSHPQYSGEESIGIIFFADVELEEFSPDVTNLIPAIPKQGNIFSYPLLGDLVEVSINPSSDHYVELGGNSTRVTAFYGPSINVHNSGGSNALPLNIKRKKNNKRESEPISYYSFKEEFRSSSREIADKQLDNYLRSIGYSSGRSDRRAPEYSLFQAANGDYIFRLDDTKENEHKLGRYFKENPNYKKLNPSEGSTIIESHGARANFCTTGATGTNSVSRNVTDDPTDGNPTIGDPAIILSLGNGRQEDINENDSSIYILSNQSVPLEPASTNYDSLHSEYVEPPSDPIDNLVVDFEELTEVPLEEEIQTEPDPFVNEFTEVTETTPSTEPKEEEQPFSDPVFDALDEAQNEDLLTYQTASISTHYETTDNDYKNLFTQPNYDDNATAATAAKAIELGIPEEEVITWDPTYTDVRIKDLHPNIRAAAKEFILRVSNELGINIRVSSGFRSFEEQKELYAQGRTKDGNIVTNAKEGESYHNYGLAFDVVEITPNGEANYGTDYDSIASIGKALGFGWGGDWASFIDKPHFEMKYGYQTSQLKTILLSQIDQGIALEGRYPRFFET